MLDAVLDTTKYQLPPLAIIKTHLRIAQILLKYTDSAYTLASNHLNKAVHNPTFLSHPLAHSRVPSISNFHHHLKLAIRLESRTSTRNSFSTLAFPRT